MTEHMSIEESATAGQTPPRTATAVDALAEAYLIRQAELDPLMATAAGIVGYDALMPDLSPAGHAERDELNARTLAELSSAVPTDDIDRVTVLAMTERLELQRELHAAGADLADLNNVASPVQNVRNVFDLMPSATTADWEVIAQRMRGVPAALAGYVSSLRAATAAGEVPPIRQVRAAVTQARANLGADGFFASFAAESGAEAGSPLAVALEEGVQAAQRGYRQLLDYFEGELAGQARDDDAVGPQRYQLYSRQFLGATVDLAESYAWGISELARITELMAQTADRIKPGASVLEAIAHLDADGTRRLSGTAALASWMQDASDRAIEALADTHFDIPGPVRTLQCRIAPTHTGVIYYTGPSEDFARPGRMWWSVPAGVAEFATWRELTTVYHEGVPGHHLQIAQTIYRKQLLNSWRRMGCWVSGHGEGWALYAEWLMAELGFLEDPGDRLGLLDGQSLRAARVVIDIGVHCGFEAPAEVGGGAWDYDKAWALLSSHSHMADEILRFELDRYLGWPGQAPSYKIGERHWLALREEVKQREGDTFDLKAFHRRALDIGGVGLDVLRRAVLGEL